MDLFNSFDDLSNENNKWITFRSELRGLDGEQNDIKIELVSDGSPRALAFFDIDGTLAHLDKIHGLAIRKLFPEENPEDLETTYFKGFKLGNSFREFDRMKGIYIDGHQEWKDPEVYFKRRFLPHQREIDEHGGKAHRTASIILKEYGEVAASVIDELNIEEPREFETQSIQPIFLLARMYARMGIPMAGFTANARVLVEKLVKYLKLADIFLDIATDEDMEGGGKEIAIDFLIKKLETKGLTVPKRRLIFVGDSLRGDLGSSLIKVGEKMNIRGTGVLVLKDRNAFLEIQKRINTDEGLKRIAESMDIYGFVVSDVPLDERGKPLLLSRYSRKFLRKL